MLRGILSAVVVLSLGILVLLTIIFTQDARSDLQEEAKKDLNAAREVVRVANRVNDYSLVYTAEMVAEMADLQHALSCPKNAADVSRRNQAEIDPQTGQPVENAENDRAADENSRVCVDTQHVLTLRLLNQFATQQMIVLQENDPRFLSERDLGASIPRSPDLFVAADASGEIVARAGNDWETYFGSDRPNMNRFEVVGRTQRDGSQYDVITWKDHSEVRESEMMQVAAAPVFSEGEGESREFLGSVIIGYKLNNAQAVDTADVLSTEDLLYFVSSQEGEVKLSGNTLDRDPGFRSAMSDQEFYEIASDGTESDEAMSLAQVARSGSGRTYFFEYKDMLFYVMPSAFSTDRESDESVAGFMVMSDIHLQTLPLRTLSRWVPIAGVLLALITVLLIIFLVKVFLQPVDNIGRGVQEVIAGNREYMWDVDDDYFSDLAHSLNIMSARLQGKPDPDSEDQEGAREWQGMVGGGGQSAGGAASGGKPKSIVGLGNLRGRSANQSDKNE